MTSQIKRVAVVGFGTMGTQISVLAAGFDYAVTVYDTDKALFDIGLEKLKAMLDTSRRLPTIPRETWLAAMKKVTFCDDLKKAIGDADLIIESVPEDLELKQRVFKELDSLAPEEAILATNSSSIPISKIESATTRPERCLNLHFYIPAKGLNIVDVMGGSRTSAEIVEAGKAWVRSIGCVPLSVKKEILGFCFNRVWRAVKRETLYLWTEDYVDFRDIDRAWMIFTGMDVGPFGLMDSIGLDVVYNIEMVYYNESKDPKDHPSKALKEMVDHKELGVKTGKGFYTYPDPEFSRPGFIGKQDAERGLRHPQP